MYPTPTFKMATLQDETLAKEWWEKPHVMEFWGVPEAHLPNFEGYINGHKDIFDYWIGSINNEPYCLLCTSDCTTLEEEGDWYGRL